ncbi:DUF4417 domain-containing protein [Ensifer sp. BR816]|uniref:DUF4417 domain-containing protein n=1 Tax=Rhizobium sp. (strain BR816) TaxID=1057002 RepID=UPI0003A97DCC|nr:DUF4417 domain-containing protein [Ensifer sp. BR816]
MSVRPAHEPSRVFRQPQQLWDDPAVHAPALGCRGCRDFGVCGGLHTEAGIFLDCHDLCTCSDKSKCDMVCRFNPAHFVARMREIDGFELSKLPRFEELPVPSLPPVVPFIHHKYSRAMPLNEPVVAIPLCELVDLGSGQLHVRTRGELSARFLVPAEASIVVSGVDKDRIIERWWELDNRPALIAQLRELGLTMVTAPNYSVLTDVPRTDNLHAMKRIFMVWSEFTAAGLPAALHVNARTEHDYSRWAALIRERPEIGVVAFEFATGCGRGERIAFHTSQLMSLARRVGRPLDIVVRGGLHVLPQLTQAFRRVTLLETHSFSRTQRRRRAYFDEAGRLHWAPSPTEIGASLDELLAHNVKVVRVAMEMAMQKTSKPIRFVRRTRDVTPNRDNETGQISFFDNAQFAIRTQIVTAKRENVIPAAKA